MTERLRGEKPSTWRPQGVFSKYNRRCMYALANERYPEAGRRGWITSATLRGETIAPKRGV